MVLIIDVDVPKMGLDLAGVITYVYPLFLLLLHDFTVLLDLELGLIITINSSHLEFTNELAIMDIPVTPHLVSTFVDFTVVSNKMCTNVLFAEGNLVIFDGAFNRKITDFVVA